MRISPGQRIKELRTLAGMSQEELGRRVGVQRAAINKYEIGTVQNIPLRTIEKIADIFEVSPQYIVGWTKDGHSDLAMEVKVLQGVSSFFGKDSVELLESYTKLNTKGKKRVQQYVNDMYLIFKDGDTDEL